MTLKILFDGVPNSRAVSGLPLKQGGTTKDGVLYRTSALDTITAEGKDQMEATPIGVVADLRTLFEKASEPDHVPHRPRHIKVKELPIKAGNLNPITFLKELHGVRGDNKEEVAKQLNAAVPTLAEMYTQMLEASAEKFAKVARLVSQVEDGKNNAVAVHCTAGKDRTGVSVALILDVVGVERDEIVSNYAISQEYLAGPWADGMLAKLKKAGIPMVENIVNMVTTTPPSAIESAFAWVEKNHGSSENYLKSGGLTDEEVSNLKAALT